MGVDTMHVRHAMTAAGRRLPGLTRLRVVLIGWVLVYHLELALHALNGTAAFEAVAMRGYLGVDGFFLLSGFALVLGYAHRPPRGIGGWARFVRDRLARVMPMHLVLLAALVLLVGAAAATGIAVNNPERFGLRELVFQAVLLHAWETTREHAWNYPSWALSAILAGYLAFPALLSVAMRLSRGALWMVVAASFAGLAVLGAMNPWLGLNHTLHFGMVRFGLEFLAGMALARLVAGQGLSRQIATAGLLLIPVGLGFGHDVLVVAGLAALVVRAALAAPAEAPPRDLAHRLGEASFGIYLSWVFVEAGLVLLLRLADPGLAARQGLMVAGLAATFLAGWIAWRVIEVPAAAWLSRGR